jgi:hypothetical protein
MCITRRTGVSRCNAYMVLNVMVTLYRIYKPEPVLESADILYWDSSIITDKAVVFSRPDIVPIGRENNGACNRCSRDRENYEI